MTISSIAFYFSIEWFVLQIVYILFNTTLRYFRESCINKFLIAFFCEVVNIIEMMSV